MTSYALRKQIEAQIQKKKIITAFFAQNVPNLEPASACNIRLQQIDIT